MKMDEIVIAGIGQIPVREHWDKSLRSMAAEAIQSAIRDSGGLKPQVLFVGNIYAANFSRQAHLSALIADYAHLTGIEAITIEASGASGGAALRQGYLAVASGLVNVALVLGVEKLTDCIGPDQEAAFSTEIDADYEAIQGLTPASQSALLAKRYIQEFRVPKDGLAGFPLTAHANGARNKNAMYRHAITMDDYLKAMHLNETLSHFDTAPHTDGAAAVLLTRRDLLPENPQADIRIAASTMGIDAFTLGERKDVLSLKAANDSFIQAFQKAGITPDKVDLFEYFDSYSIYAALSLEAAGYAGRGEGWKLGKERSIALTGQIPCSTMGGLKARGNPGGATGVYQAVEAALQLRGQAGTNQIPGATYALIQCLGGPASIAITHILERIS
jgi:acetyl-CoA C-acetyltransferase